MASKHERLNSVTRSYTASTSVNGPRVPFGSVSGGMMCVTSITGGATKITWHMTLEPEGQVLPIMSAGAAVETAVVANTAYALPAALEYAAFLVPITDAGTVAFRMSVKG